MKKKSGYTLVEGLVSMLIVSVIGIMTINFSSGYFKNTYNRDVAQKAVISNISILERLKAEVTTIPQLYAFSRKNDIKIIAIGVGEVEFDNDGKINIMSNEAYGFSQELLMNKPKLFRIEIGGDIPNTKLITIISLEG